MGTLINDKDQAFLDHIAQEVNCLAGTNAVIFQFDEENSKRDWVYGESVSREYKKNDKDLEGINCPVLFKSPERSPISGEQGFHMEKTSSVFVARKDLDDRDLRRPIVGDLWLLWGRYYDVTKSGATEGRFSDTGRTSSYEVDVVRRTKDVPEGLWFSPPPDPDADGQD